MKKFFYYLFTVLFTLIHFKVTGFAACTLFNSSGQMINANHDFLAMLLASNPCPANVFEFRQMIKNSKLGLKTTMVANRGFHNPNQGSFSLFEMVFGEFKTLDNQLSINPGDVFFGHFTSINTEGDLIADQNKELNSLMIEALAWDHRKEVFNFYELRGTGSGSQWFYRGDSHDIVADNELLHRQKDPNNPKFGSRLRCSGCHGAGGPIMKELDTPHNDWWEPNRGLDFGGRKPNLALKEIMQNLVSSEALAKNVLIGVKKLEPSKALHQIQTHSFQELIRPLFCPVELNLMSDVFPNDLVQSEISIPAEFFVDSRFLKAEEKQTISISRTFYQMALNNVGSYFPETALNDADHAWLTPVKAKSDQIAIDNLIQRRLIDKKFVFDVLDVDSTNPIFSYERCALLRFVPNTITSDWKASFMKNLAQSQDSAAKKLLKNLNSPQQDAEFYRQKTRNFLHHCQVRAQTDEYVLKLYQLLMQRRAEVRTSEISKNPLGQILEPGFRIIFPESMGMPPSEPLKLDTNCEFVEEKG
ncbi:rod shape-determining protein MreB [Legionella wadsworthii]|uniref:Rod shape-determining protein MreB n=1 Tax=Legionella wadsworthii TaxID=28088 RepID=A0A378LTC0_9GAMM|nr:hypothetical protein [Legionella wadsworthii]STY30416.1 rod shape-determining protein MreB [Legionella wadsworthii]